MDVKGHDITDLIEGRRVLNWEHNNDSSEDIIGAIIFAKKIYKESDCENDRQREYFKKSGGPYVYVIAELLDDEEHPGAIAAAALIRYYHRRNIKILAGFSIEGHTLVRDDNILARSVGRRVALTLRPCNKACETGVLDDPSISEVYKKTTKKSESKIPVYEVDNIILEDPVVEILNNVAALNKTLTAGNYDVAPSALTGGAALQIENFAGAKNKIKAALRDWNRTKPLKTVIKAALPEISDEYVDHFVDVAEDMMLKKGLPVPVRVGINHAHLESDDDQKRLIDGLFLDPDHLKEAKRQTVQNDLGSDVTVKQPSRNKAGMDSGTAASTYYRTARDVFNMGDNVPVTGQFSHDKLAREDNDTTHLASEKRQGLKSAYDPSVDLGGAIENSAKTGEFFKLGLMDLILGHNDRHLGNIMLDHKGRIIHVDNEHSFAYPEGRSPLAPSVVYDRPIPPEVSAWLQGIDSKLLIHRLNRAGLDPAKIKRAVLQLRLAQKKARAGYPFGNIIGVVRKDQ